MTAPDTTPDDAEIDADLALSIYDYDLTEHYPEFSHSAMREAWRQLVTARDWRACLGCGMALIGGALLALDLWEGWRR
jgi:hypothetical protein